MELCIADQKNMLRCPPLLVVYPTSPQRMSSFWQIHCKKRLSIFPPQAGMSLTKLREELNYSRLERVWLVASQLGTGKSFTSFYSVECRAKFIPISTMYDFVCVCQLMEVDMMGW